MEVLSKYLVAEDTMYSINGGRDICISFCLDEERVEEGKKIKFLDTARFTLANCVHTSPHLQCLLSDFIAGGGYTLCPIADTPQCRGT